MESKNKYLIMLFIFIAVIIITGTFAWLTYRSKKTALVFTVGDMNRGYITLSPYQLDAEIDPELGYSDSEYVTITADNHNNTEPLKYSIFYEIEEIAQELRINDFKYTILRSSNGTTYTEYKTGNFANATDNSKVVISDEIVPAEGAYYYKVYLWLDGSNNSHSGIEGATFKGNLKARIQGKEKAYLTSLNNTTGYFKQAEYKTKIYNVYFVFEDTVPNNAITIAGLNQNYYDLSADQDESIKGWLIETDTDKYDLYIGSQNKIYATTLENLFFGMTSVETISLFNLDTREATSMKQMFAMCYALISLDLSNFDTSNVTAMNSMFLHCRSLTTLDLSNFDTSKVTTMMYMFLGCTSLTSLDISTWNTPMLEEMWGMFISCSSLTSINILSFDTSKVKHMTNLFQDCSSLTSLNISNFDTSSVIDMGAMFQGCSGLTSLSITHFDTTKVTSMSNMFNGDTGLTTLDLSSFDTSIVSRMHNMFKDCTNLSTIYVSDRWSTAAITNANYGVDLFLNATNLPNYDSNVVDKSKAYYGTGGYLTYKAYTPPSSGS